MKNKSYTQKLINLKDIDLSEEEAISAIEDYKEYCKSENIPMIGEMGKKNTDYNTYDMIDFNNACVEYKNLWVEDGYIWGEYIPTKNGPGVMVKYIHELYCDKNPEIKPIFSIRFIKCNNGGNSITEIIGIDLLSFKGLAFKK